MRKIVAISQYEDKGKLRRLAEKQLGNKTLKDGYVLLDDNKLVGYIFLEDLGESNIKIDWIWAPGHGVYFLNKIEQMLARKYDKITLKVSIDPHESKDTVLRRLNFYSKMGYRAVDIKFRPKHGPILTMTKNIQ